MKELKDEEIQKILEEQFSKGQAGNESVQALKAGAGGKNDHALYENLFNILKQEPPAGPSYAFSSKIKHRLEAAAARKSNYRFHVALCGIFLACAAFLWGILFVIDFSYGTEIRSVFINNKGIFIFGFACFFIIQYLDQRTVKRIKPGS